MKEWKVIGTLLAWVWVLLLTGCQLGASIMPKDNGDASYTIGQIMLVVANQRNSYQSVLTSDIWGVTINERGERDPAGKSYETFLLEQTKMFMEELKTMNLLAEAQGIELTNQEISKVNEAAKVYYDSLSEADLEYTKAKLSDVEKFYREYCLANKLVNELTKDSIVEVSDSDAKVIGILQIKLDSESSANEVYAKVTEEGADFAAIGRQYSQEPIEERKIGRGEEYEAFEEAAFSLEQDQISPVVHLDNAYYILKCVDEYDPDATQQRKVQMTLDQKDRLFRQIYNEFAAEHAVVFQDDIWSRIRLDEGADSSTSDLFQIYQTYFPD